MFVLPVLDEAAPKRDLWRRVFGDKPQTPAMKTARKHVEVLRPMIREIDAKLEAFLGALKDGEPNLPAARDSTGRMTAFAAKDDRLFASAP